MLKATAFFLAVLTSFFVLASCGKAQPKETETVNGTEPPRPHDTVLPPDFLVTDVPSPDPDAVAQMQELCDERAREIAEYIKGNTPVYKKAVASDTSTDTETKYEKYTPYVSYFYQDISSGVTMSHDGDTVRYSASLIKEPYILWALKKLEAQEAESDFEQGGKYDVNNIFTYQRENYRSGSGIIQKSKYGTEYSYLELLKLTVTNSDNVAFYELRKTYGVMEFYEYCEQLGVKSPQRSLYNLSARECAIFLAETYKYFESGSKYAVLLGEWMQKTNYRILLPKALSSDVANKYGWDKNSYHDMGIAFHEKPYILVIMTGLDNGTGRDSEFIRSLAKKVETVHNEINGAEK